VLTLQDASTIYLLADTPIMRKLVGKNIEVYEYPDGGIAKPKSLHRCRLF
jgi:hypothetical protein